MTRALVTTTTLSDLLLQLLLPAAEAQILQRPYFWNSHSPLSNGQTCLVFSHLEMQWKWNAWLQTPQATVHSSLVWEPWFAWHSMQRSIMWLRQMAQLSTTMSHAHNATALHFLISKRFSPGGPGSLADEEAIAARCVPVCW